jgi:hypothetical protein
VWGAATTFSPTKAYIFGNPTPDEAALLIILFARQVGGMLVPLNEKETTATTFPLDGTMLVNTRHYIVKTQGDVALAAADLIEEQLHN